MQSTSINDEDLRRRRQRRRRHRPISNVDSVPANSLSPSAGKNDISQNKSQRILSTTNRMDDPFNLIAMAIDHDESQRDALEILQVPLETGKLYHNEKLFLKAVSNLRKESRSFHLGWLLPFLPQLNYWKKCSPGKVTDSISREKQDPFKEQTTAKHQISTRSAAITPIILSGLLASLDNANFSERQESDYAQTSVAATTATSTELVNYTVGMRRAALARAHLRIKRERIQRIVKPVLAIVACLGLYSYAWSSLQRLLVGFYGITNTILRAPETNKSDPTEVTMDILRLNTSPCRSRVNADHYGRLSNYAKACRITEATTFELLTSPHNSRHTKLFARRAYDEIEGDLLLANQESRTKFSADMMKYDDDYADDTELPFYAMHTTLGDNESSNIPLDNVIYGRRTAKDKLQKQRWKRRRRRQQKYKQHQQQRMDGSNIDGIAEAYEKLSSAVQFWGDTTVNQLVREAIVEAHYEAGSFSSLSSKSLKSSHNKLKILDVGSGLSGTLYSLCTPEFPFEHWSYHGITISQPEVRRAIQLVDTFIRPIISKASEPTLGNHEDPGVEAIDPSNSKSFPLSNITIQRRSFDDPLPLKEYTTMVAIESLAFSNNITNTLINLAGSLKQKGTMIIIDDVVAPWARSSGNDGSREPEDNDFVKHMSKLSGKPSLLTHDQWLESFAAAGLELYRVHDLTLEFDALSMDTAGATAITGLPLIGFFRGEKPWYSIGHSVIKKLMNWFGRFNQDGSVKDDDGNLSTRALYLMEDLIANNQANVYRRAAHQRADLGYYMYISVKR